MGNEKIFTAKQFNSYSKDGEDFKKNGETIPSDSENPMTEKQFKQLVATEVQKFINRSFDNIVVLVGAGASVVINDSGIDKRYGKTVAMIAQNVYGQLENGTHSFQEEEQTDVFKLEELIEKSQYPNQLEFDDENKLKNFDLEDFLSYIISFQKFAISDDKQKLLDTIRAIQKIIVTDVSYDHDKDVFKHISFLNILSNLTKSENKLNIVTTNYDTLLEDAAESAKYTVFDGFSFSRIPKFDSDNFDWSLVKNVSAVKTHELVYKSNVINLLKIHGSITWEESKSGKNIIRKNEGNVEHPVMVFPSSDKYAQSYQRPYFDLFTKFQELLKKPNTLLISTGFSFSDNHISQMILSAIKNNESLSALITDFNIDSEDKNENWKELEKDMDANYSIAFLKATMNTDLTDFLGGKVNDD
ncbi:SIR2 family protein [Lactococcus termiticola]|uniref:Uncharacterized protein n=1 Tax=Lactococcus termiticola TaxID=2169526 RepID=A0A2R5HHN9_9LACT|nr:SIR2 family protein [Lactococcus termiticola]GBG97559.1 hypothetical protein NtB2_01711 [Lactococcus termiticola]